MMLRKDDGTRKNLEGTNYSDLNAPGEKRDFHPLPNPVNNTVHADTVSHGDGSRKNPFPLANMDYALLNKPIENFACYSVHNANTVVGDYTVAMGGRSPGMGTADPDIIDCVRFAEFKARKVTDKNKYKDSIWKLHLSVHPDDVGKAWNLVYPELMKKGFPHFKVTRVNLVPRDKAEKEKQTLEAKNPVFNDAAAYADYLKINSDIDTMNRVCDGMQITIYIPKDQEKIYNEFGLEIENLLIKHNIRPGIINPSDRVLGLYFSLRQENSSIDPDMYVSYDKAKHYMFDAENDPFRASKKTWKTEKLTDGDLDFAKLTKHVKVVGEKLSAAEEKYVGNTEKDIQGDDDFKTFVLLYKSYRRHLRQIIDVLIASQGKLTDVDGFKALIQELKVYNDLVVMGAKHNIKSLLSKDAAYQSQLKNLQKIAQNARPRLARKQTLADILAVAKASKGGAAIATQVASAAMQVVVDETQPARPKLVRKPGAKIVVSPDVIKKADKSLAERKKEARKAESLLFQSGITRKVSALIDHAKRRKDEAEREPEPHLSETSVSRSFDASASATQASVVVAPVVPPADRDKLDDSIKNVLKEGADHSSLPATDKDVDRSVLEEISETEPLLSDATVEHKIPSGVDGGPDDKAMSKMLSGRSSVALPKANPSYDDMYHKPSKPNTLAYVLGGIAVALVLTIVIVASSGVAAGAIMGLGALILGAVGTTATASLGAAIIGVGMAIAGALVGLFAKKNADKSYQFYKGKQQSSDEVKRAPIPAAPRRRPVPAITSEASISSGPVSSAGRILEEDLSESEEEEERLEDKRETKKTKPVGSLPKSAPIQVGSLSKSSSTLYGSSQGEVGSTTRLGTSHGSASSLGRSVT